MPLDVEENTTANLDRMLKAGELDAVISRAALSAVPASRPSRSTKKRSASPAPARHALARRKTIAVEDLDAGDAAAAAGRPLLPRPGAGCLQRILASAGSRPPGEFAGNAAQHGRLGTGRDGTAGDRAHRAATPTPLVKAVEFTAPCPVRRVAPRLAARIPPARRAGKARRRRAQPAPAGDEPLVSSYCTRTASPSIGACRRACSSPSSR